MREKGLEKRRHQKQLTDRERQHKEFVRSGEFDKLSPVETLNRGNRVVVKERATIGTVTAVRNNGWMSVRFADEKVTATVTLHISTVRRAEDYEKKLREKSQ
ncbi:MAG: hypothetical protein Q8Q13_02790 [bacterium]|nr:hypothetical protein [bacterium]